MLGVRGLLDLAILEHVSRHAAVPLGFFMHPNNVDVLVEEKGPQLRVADGLGCVFCRGVCSFQTTTWQAR